MPDDMEEYGFLDDQDETRPQDENKSFVELRKHANKLEKENKAAAAELEALRSFKAEYDGKLRQETVNATFTELGLNPTHAKFWALENPETEPAKESVAKWAVDNGFAQEESFSSKPTAETGFTPTVLPEGSSIDAKVYTQDEIMELYRTDPDKVKALYNRGRLKLEKLPGSAAL
jgi:hypothetical protein